MKRIIIVGKGGSGKDYLKDKFIKHGFTRSISFTTRPKRENEIDTLDYHFIEEEVFLRMIELNCFQEYDNFNGWYYGTDNITWESNNIFIKTPKGVSKISKEDRKTCFIIYLDIPENIIFERISKRKDADSAQRRIEADRIDFDNFTDFDLRITNPDF
jgi:guanylate kinase